MKVPHLNQRGVTLVEVLATLVLLTFVAGIAYSFLINSYTFQERTSERVSIVQESNTLSTSMRQIHEQGGDIFFTENGQLRADSSTGRILHDERTRVTNLYVDGIQIDPGTNLSINFDQHDIKATILNGQYEHTIDTTLDRLSYFSYQSGTPVDDGNEVTPPDEDTEVPEEPNEEPETPPSEEDIDEVEFPNNSEEHVYIDGIFRHAGNNQKCNFTGNTKTSQTVLNNQSDGLGPCDYAGVYSGNLLFINQIRLDSTPFNVDGSLYLKNGLAENGNNASINVTNHVVSLKDINLRGYSLFNRGHLIGSHNIKIENAHSFIDIKGSVKAGSQFYLDSPTPSHIARNLTASSLSIRNQSQLNVGGNASIAGDILFNAGGRLQASNVQARNLSSQNQATFNISGNLLLQQELSLENRGNYQVGGNLSANNVNFKNGASVEVRGNLKISSNRNSNTFNSGRICVFGNADLHNNNNYTDTLVKSEYSSCENVNGNGIFLIR
ncbi:prepilin-type N-terminal cleavage/methylation domain-containing protein [Paenalkalicoccus suaedae]|uniref:Prepilin-type N-terminal cleavage/methylation domain-containing protein n=1 Tax=Paenalkalicoccus suaedae TaxID=2592382 RepID=A0A859FJ36_9BACI|nr:prepilin-type N-terminal cleavage/methylation domain-containing protein [Paenalkalicoccus suaedae]QKS72395.1 prepilin-type N-terminal cleavage/methylation domain-containing protein [Paenalkalicoccus suaedae]